MAPVRTDLLPSLAGAAFFVLTLSASASRFPLPASSLVPGSEGSVPGSGFERQRRRPAPSAQRPTPSGQPPAPSAQRRPPSADRPAPSAQRRAPSADRPAPSADRRPP